MRTLVTGADGFAGRFVVEELKQNGHTPLKCLYPENVNGGPGGYVCDIRNRDEVGRLVRNLQPDACIHLAGLAFVPLSWENPALVLEVNLMGTIHLLEAFRRYCPTASLLFVSSAEVYGRSPGEIPFVEETPLRPATPYGISKAAADQMVRLYAEKWRLPALVVRPQNHIGPGQSSDYVTVALAEQLRDMASGKAPPVIWVGNLESERNFLDVRDVARGYRLLIERGRPGESYNMASGTLIKIQTVFDRLCVLFDVTPRVEIDEQRYRPTDTGYRFWIPIRFTIIRAGNLKFLSPGRSRTWWQIYAVNVREPCWCSPGFGLDNTPRPCLR